MVGHQDAVVFFQAGYCLLGQFIAAEGSIRGYSDLARAGNGNQVVAGRNRFAQDGKSGGKTGVGMNKTYNIALYIEEVAELYYYARAIGTPALLTGKEMDAAHERFKTYGSKSSSR